MSVISILSVIQTLQALLPGSQWMPSNRLELGVISTNYAFIQAKSEGKNPVDFASHIVLKLRTDIESTNLFSLVEISNTGPFINLNFTSEGWSTLFQNLATPQVISDPTRAVLLEYVSPNVAKPLHVGHMRNADIGESLFRVLTLKYPNIMSDNHWGDWGVQFGILLWAWAQFLQAGELEVVVNETLETISMQTYQTQPIDTLVKLYVWGNQQKTNIADFDEVVRQEFILLEQKDATRLALWQQFVEVSKKEIAADLALLNVTPHTIEQGESFYEDDMQKIREFCDTHTIWKKEGNARYFDFQELNEQWTTASDSIKKVLKKLTGGEESGSTSDSKMGRGYLISTQGYTTYLFRDVATRWQWARDHKRDLVITLTDHSQSHNFDQTFVIIAYLISLPEFQTFVGKDVIDRLTFEHLIHLPYGYLTLPEGKMSTRKGNFLTAHDLINKIISAAEKTLLEKNPEADTFPEFPLLAQKVAIAALKWFDLSRDCIHDLVLDIPKILQFEGNTGVYQLYTLARLRSIVAKNSSNAQSESTSIYSNINPSLLNSEEILILKKMALMPIILESVVSQYKPHFICNQLYEVSSAVNSWYSQFNVSQETNSDRKNTLLAFCGLTAHFLHSHLELLAIDPVESM